MSEFIRTIRDGFACILVLVEAESPYVSIHGGDRIGMMVNPASVPAEYTPGVIEGADYEDDYNDCSSRDLLIFTADTALVVVGEYTSGHVEGGRRVHQALLDAVLFISERASGLPLEDDDD